MVSLTMFTGVSRNDFLLHKVSVYLQSETNTDAICPNTLTGCQLFTERYHFGNLILNVGCRALKIACQIDSHRQQNGKVDLFMQKRCVSYYQPAGTSRLG